MTKSPITPSHLSKGHCLPCEGGVAPLTNTEEDLYHSSVEHWDIERSQTPHVLTRTIKAKNFKDVISLVNVIAELAEAEGHHPDLNLHDYKQLTITLSTHAINGLSLNDFILAAKIDEVVSQANY